MWKRLESREIRRRRASSARIAARRGITVARAGDRPRPDRPEGDDLLPQIRHIVILMMENHSYDNHLGMLTDRGEGLPRHERSRLAAHAADVALRRARRLLRPRAAA